MATMAELATAQEAVVVTAQNGCDGRDGVPVSCADDMIGDDLLGKERIGVVMFREASQLPPSS